MSNLFRFHRQLCIIYLLLLLTFTVNMSQAKLIGLDFEVFGVVQGVFFRKYTEKQAKSLGLKGWCMNTEIGTVRGQLEGEEPKIEDMKHWLEKKGSPQSRIDRAVFTNEKPISSYTFTNFAIRR